MTNKSNASDGGGGQDVIMSPHSWFPSVGCVPSQTKRRYSRPRLKRDEMCLGPRNNNTHLSRSARILPLSQTFTVGAACHPTGYAAHSAQHRPGCKHGRKSTRGLCILERIPKSTSSVLPRSSISLLTPAHSQLRPRLWEGGQCK